MKLSLDEKRLFTQANRILSYMTKRANDKNVSNALKFAQRDLNIFGKMSKYGVNKSTTERQKNALLRSAQKLIDSPYATKKGTQNLYKQQRNTFAKRYGLTKKQASKMIDLFDADKNPEVAQAWERIRYEVNYQAIKPHLKDEMSDMVNDIGDKKFSLMMRLYIESGLSSEINFAQFLSDDDYTTFFESNNLETLQNFIDGKEWE